MNTNSHAGSTNTDPRKWGLIAGLIFVVFTFGVLGSALPSSAGNSHAEALTTPTATPAPGLVEFAASFTVGDIGQFAQSPAAAAQAVGPDGAVVILDEGFEGAWPPPGWAAQPNWGASNCRAFAGAKSAWVEGGAGLACGSNYYNDENAFLIYGPFSLADATAAALSLKLWLNSESNYDFLCRMVSTDGKSFDGMCTHGASNGWIERTLDLSALAGKSSAWIAFVWNTDPLFSRAEGAFVDDVRLIKTTGGPTATPTPTATLTPTTGPTATATATSVPLPTPSWWWQIQRVQGSVKGWGDLDFNGAGQPCIGFADTWDVRLACWNGSSWQIEGIGADWQDIYVSLAFDNLGRPHMSYVYNFTSAALWYAYKDASGWHHEEIDSVQFTGGYHSLAVDAQGNPHIAYYTGSEVKYAHKDAAGWHTESIGASGQTDYPSLALDSSGYPHISYQQFNYGDLMYAVKDSAGWHHETVDAEGRTGAYSSLALDAQGNPHISYYRVTSSAASDYSCDLKYARRSGVSWVSETVHDASGSCEFSQNNTSLKLDGSGWPHISYYQPLDQALWYARWDGSGWHTELVASGNVGRGNSLAFNPAGKPYISYVHSSGSSPALNLAVRLDRPQPSPTPSPTATPVTPTPVLPSGQAQSHNPAIAPAVGGGAVVTWQDDRFGGRYDDDVFARRFAADGRAIWPTDVRVSRGAGVGGDRNPSITTDPNGHIWVVWQGPTFGHEIQAQMLDSAGVHLWANDFDIGSGFEPEIGLDANGNWYVGWANRFDDCTVWPRGTSGSCSTVQASRIGERPWHETATDPIYVHAYGPDAAIDLDGNVHLVWQQGSSQGDSNIFGVALSSAGDRRWVNPVRINSDAGTAPQEYPRVAVDALGNSIVAWADKRNGQWDIYTQKLDINMGHRLWADDIRVNSDATSSDQVEPDLIIGSDGYVYVVWADGRNGTRNIYAQKLTLDGVKVWPQDLRIGAAGPAAARSKPVIAQDARGFLYIAWESQSDIYIQSYTASGDRCWSVDVAVEGIYATPSVICAPPPTPTPTPTATPSAPWLAWREPNRHLLVAERGASIDVLYGNLATPAVLVATLTGPAVFADGSQALTAGITAANGSYAFILRPAPGASRGDTFTLRITLSSLQLEKTGKIATDVYLPLVLRR